jgi:hypothetical protein
MLEIISNHDIEYYYEQNKRKLLENVFLVNHI